MVKLNMRKSFPFVFFFLSLVLSVPNQVIGFLKRFCIQRPISIFENKPCRNNTTASQLVIANINDDHFSLSTGIPLIVFQLGADNFVYIYSCKFSRGGNISSRRPKTYEEKKLLKGSVWIPENTKEKK